MPLKKVAVFLMSIDREKGQNIIALMDNAEIRAVVTEIKRLPALSQEEKESIRAEFNELGYTEQQNPSEILTIMRFLFNGSKISK
jgi:flagellar motor switch protein FliG